MDRRKFITAAVTALTGSTVAFAGCGGPGGGAEETPADEGGATAEEDGGVAGEETETEAAGGAEDETETATEAAGGEEETETTAGGETETAAEGETETTADGGGGTTVAMVTQDDQFYFDPIGLHVEQGETVTWELESGTHSSTAYSEDHDAADTTLIPEGAEPWDSGRLSEQGATFEHTFDTQGTYDYFCIPHKQLGMVGRVVVGEPGGPAEGGQPPDGEVPESQIIVDQGSVGFDEFSS